GRCFRAGGRRRRTVLAARRAARLRQAGGVAGARRGDGRRRRTVRHLQLHHPDDDERRPLRRLQHDLAARPLRPRHDDRQPGRRAALGPLAGAHAAVLARRADRGLDRVPGRRPQPGHRRGGDLPVPALLAGRAAHAAGADYSAGGRRAEPGRRLDPGGLQHRQLHRRLLRRPGHLGRVRIRLAQRGGRRARRRRPRPGDHRGARRARSNRAHGRGVEYSGGPRHGAARKGSARKDRRVTTPTPTTFGIIGSGWRAEFFVRLAALLPDRLTLVGAAARRARSAERITAHWRVPAYLSPQELISKQSPDFVVTSVSWPANPEVIAAAVEAGVKVLAETPPAPDADGLRALWARVGERRMVQVAEQYLLMPGHAARRELVERGTIGRPTSVQVSSTHGYHAVSMIRGLLGVDFEPVRVTASRFTAPLLDPLTRDGWTGDESAKDAETTLATLDFGNGASGLYDFTSNQWHN